MSCPATLVAPAVESSIAVEDAVENRGLSRFRCVLAVKGFRLARRRASPSPKRRKNQSRSKTAFLEFSGP